MAGLREAVEALEVHGHRYSPAAQKMIDR